jgi:hypothetical protein
MLNGKVRCLEWEGSVYKKGNVYEFINGHTYLEGGKKSQSWDSLEELNYRNQGYGKFEMVVKEPHKSLLKSGMKVVMRDRIERYVILEIRKIFRENLEYLFLTDFTEELNCIINKFDVMEIWDGETLIAKRSEKTAQQIEIERIENEMRKLADDLRKVKGE